ncbi:MAG: putative motility protein [Spirochaetaceae bacterium]
MVESLGSASSMMSHAQLAQQTNTAVMKESLNVQEMQGEGVNRLLSSAASVTAAPQQIQDPMLGQTVDIEA